MEREEVLLRSGFLGHASGEMIHVENSIECSLGPCCPWHNGPDRGGRIWLPPEQSPSSPLRPTFLRVLFVRLSRRILFSPPGWRPFVLLAAQGMAIRERGCL